MPKPHAGTGFFPQPIIDAAIASQHKWRVPASVTLAQWALESKWGTRTPPNSNNPFGIKAARGQPSVEAQTSENVHGKKIITQAKFRKFASLTDAFEEHGRLLANNPHYARAMTHVDDPDAFADALTGVYATDPHYGASLKILMGRYNLHQYDGP